MNFYLYLPLLFLKFWFVDAPIRLIRFFMTVNHAALQVLSFGVLIKTFFKPLKNEYRKGLVAFSVIFGMILKSTLIFADLIVLAFIIFLEVLFLGGFILWPFLSFYILTI